MQEHMLLHTRESSTQNNTYCILSGICSYTPDRHPHRITIFVFCLLCRSICSYIPDSHPHRIRCIVFCLVCSSVCSYKPDSHLHRITSTKFRINNSCFSWWWAHNRSKHVEVDKHTKNKYTRNKLCTVLALFTEQFMNVLFWLSFYDSAVLMLLKSLIDRYCILFN
jgi:hypothetical protein